MRYPFYLMSLMLLVLSACGSNKELTRNWERISQEHSVLVGARVEELQSGKVLLSQNSEKYFVPASNIKLLTLSAALRYLEDSLSSIGLARLGDSVILKGMADPLFLTAQKDEEFLRQLTEPGQSLFLLPQELEDQAFAPGWSWEDYPYAFMAERSVFPMYGNTLSVNIEEEGLRIEPALFAPQIEWVQGRHPARAADQNLFYLDSLNLGSRRSIPFKVSQQLQADLLTEITGKKVALIDPDKAQEFKVYRLSSRREALKKMIEQSDNFIAEQLLLQLAQKKLNRYNTEVLIDSLLNQDFSRLDQRPKWIDGSGLSRYNLMTPETGVSLMRGLVDTLSWKGIEDLFPELGVEGTLKQGYSDQIRGVYAKSGSMSGVYCITGAMRNKENEVLIFSLMFNNFKGSFAPIKKAVETLLFDLYEGR